MPARRGRERVDESEITQRPSNRHRQPVDPHRQGAPHPIAISLSLLLRPIAAHQRIRLAAASVIQPASELGQAGVDELFQQTIGALNLQSIPKKIFDRQLAFNLYPAENAREVERYVAQQVRSVLGKTLPIALSITQGTTFHGHSISLFVQCDGKPDRDAVADLYRDNDAIAIADDDPFGTIDAAGRDEVLVGRISLDPEMHDGVWLWAVIDNLRRASALNAVLIAEELIARFGEPPN